MTTSQLIPIPSVDVPAEADRPAKVLKLAQEAFLSGGRSKLTLGACLMEIRDNRYWEKAGGDKSFEQFAYREFGYANSTVSSLIQVYAMFIEDFHKNPSEIQHLPWAKLAMICPVVTEENVDGLLVLADQYNQAELRKHIKLLQGKHVTQSSDSKGTKFTFHIPDDQAEVVKSALELSEEINQTEIPGLALEAIMADYLLQHQSDTPEDHLDAVIATLERTHNIKITYERLG